MESSTFQQELLAGARRQELLLEKMCCLLVGLTEKIDRLGTLQAASSTESDSETEMVPPKCAESPEVVSFRPAPEESDAELDLPLPVPPLHATEQAPGGPQEAAEEGDDDDLFGSDSETEMVPPLRAESPEVVSFHPAFEGFQGTWVHSIAALGLVFVTGDEVQLGLMQGVLTTVEHEPHARVHVWGSVAESVSDKEIHWKHPDGTAYTWWRYEPPVVSKRPCQEELPGSAKRARLTDGPETEA